MPRSLADWLLSGGAVIAVMAACILTWKNTNLSPEASPSNLWPLIAGSAIAFGCALVAIGTDLQNSVTTRLGALANTSILQSRQGWLCLVGWGAFDAAMLQVVLLNPEWASQTFHFDLGKNLLWAGLVVGISAIIIIRSKLFKQGNVEWGAEWIYLWSSAQVIDSVNRNRITIKRKWEAKFRKFVDDQKSYPSLFTDLEAHMTGILAGKSQAVQAALTQEFQQLRTKYNPSNTPDTDPDVSKTINGSAPARRYLIRRRPGPRWP